ncbi:hypothetical protein TSUD_316410 [Trifolium subterraneum]|uniref:Uncharacterized protein n=1 Tax=Trifolium subterraneum TaxID=3900 RepID=A0A2Z6NKW1_TRISU|nr:hypothetical protein TSUD_316410 [Trifolium subterraneum]
MSEHNNHPHQPESEDGAGKIGTSTNKFVTIVMALPWKTKACFEESRRSLSSMVMLMKTVKTQKQPRDVIVKNHDLHFLSKHND